MLDIQRRPTKLFNMINGILKCSKVALRHFRIEPGEADETRKNIEETLVSILNIQNFIITARNYITCSRRLLVQALFLVQSLNFRLWLMLGLCCTVLPVSQLHHPISDGNFCDFQPSFGCTLIGRKLERFV